MLRRAAALEDEYYMSDRDTEENEMNNIADIDTRGRFEPLRAFNFEMKFLDYPEIHLSVRKVLINDTGVRVDFVCHDATIADILRLVQTREGSSVKIKLDFLTPEGRRVHSLEFFPSKTAYKMELDYTANDILKTTVWFTPIHEFKGLSVEEYKGPNP